MIRVFKRFGIGLMGWAPVLVIFSCTEPESTPLTEFILRTQVLMVTLPEFSEELDLKRAAYPYKIDENPTEYNEMVIHLVRVLSEEIILLSAATDKGIIITDQELEAAELEFKKDYPEDSFDQLLLTNAISYPFWKKRFKRDLIIEKLIETEIKKKVEISSDDIVNFYQQIQSKNLADKTSGAQDISNGKELVQRLRMQKTQKHYDHWLEALIKQYPVEINKEKLKAFLIEIDK